MTDIPGQEAYYWSSSTSLFFRMTLRLTPIEPRTGVLYAKSYWYIALDADRNTFIDWFIHLDGSANALFTYPNTTGPDNIPDATANFTLTAPLASGYAQIVPAGD